MKPKGTREISSVVVEAIRRSLLDWFRLNKRDLPWRRNQDDAYAVWVSEIMLQQTQVATVIPYYERWMARFPTLQSLASAPLEDVLSIWSGLGYYARARNLHLASQAIVTRFNGQVPAGEVDLGSLPGIGMYTSGAIRSIAYNQSAAILDANVLRVISRLFKIEGSPKSAGNQSTLWDAARQLVPDGEARDFNQAVMELGALVCTSADPSCEICPLLAVCGAGNTSSPIDWPDMPPGKSTVRQTHVSAVTYDKGRILLIRRPPHGLWGGLWEFPRRVSEPGETPSNCAERAVLEVLGMHVRALTAIGSVNHSVTHHAIKLHGILVETIDGGSDNRDCAEHRWLDCEEASRLPLSSPQSQLLSKVRTLLDERSPNKSTASH
jgi:A/G-specific adenine glycosylase